MAIMEFIRCSNGSEVYSLPRYLYLVLLFLSRNYQRRLLCDFSAVVEGCKKRKQTHTYTYTHTLTQTDTHRHTQTHTYTYMYVYTYTYTYNYTYIHTHSYSYTYTYTYKYICIYTHRQPMIEKDTSWAPGQAKLICPCLDSVGSQSGSFSSSWFLE